MADRASPLQVPASVNADQRRAADPHNSAWVAASAGTGKTKVLTDRVLRLLLAGSKPAEILCLTYTKAAAAEMANRIATRLSRWATLPVQAPDKAPSLIREFADLGILAPQQRDFDRARTLFAAMLDCAGGMKIQTIHSFCQSLLARFPLEARLPPGFTVLDDRALGELTRQTFEKLMTDVGRRPHEPFAVALANLLRQIGDRALKKLLTGDVIAARAQILTTDRASSIAALAAELGIAPDLQADEIAARAVAGIPVDSLRELAGLMAASKGVKDRKFAEGIHVFLSLDPAAQARQWEEDYAALFLTKDGEPVKSLVSKAVTDAAPQLADLARQEQQRVYTMKGWQLKARLLDVNRDFYTVARGWLERLEQIKHRHASLDFNDLIERTRDLLADPQRAAWVLYKLGYEVQHVLVDEAQDTSQLQWDIVGHLTAEYFAGEGATRGHTLFVVGDEKQSIYSFNGADPVAFMMKRGDYGDSARSAGARWADVPLSLSFRSTGAVLNLVNEVFSDDNVRQGVSQDPFTQAPARAFDSGTVELWSPLLKQPQAAGDKETWTLPLERQAQTTPSIQLARLIAGRIRHWLDTREMLVARGRPIEAGDIMVLVPRRNVFFPQLVRALKEKNIPVAGVDRMIITEQLPVQDLLALLNFLSLPEDDLNLAALLKTPLIGLGEDDLFTLCHGRDGTVWAALESRQAEAPFDAIYRYLAELRALVDQMRPYELLQKIINGSCPASPTGSVRQAIWQRLGFDALDPLDELLTEALRFEEQQLPTLQHFLAWLTEDEIEKKRELGQAGGQVRIMTAHASKGLESPIVFVVDLPSGKNKTAQLLPGAEGTPLLFVPRADYRDDVAAHRQQLMSDAADEENRRLLYVALTRAEDRLYICGAYPKEMPLKAWHHAVAPAVEKLGVEIETSAAEQDLGLTKIWRYETPQLVDVASASAAPQVEIKSQELPHWATRPIIPPTGMARPLAPSRIAEPELAVLSPAGPDAIRRFQRGNLTHKLLQYLPDAAPDQRRAAAARYLQKNAADISADLQASIIDEVMTILENSAVADLFGPASQAEVPLVGVVGEVPISGQVDRLLVTPDMVWIVDYKTNRPPPRQVEGVAAAYRVQMAYYAALLKQIYPGRAIRASLLWTDGAQLMDLPTALLQLHLPTGISL